MGLRRDKIKLNERARVGAQMRSGDTFGWKCHTTVEKYTVEGFHAGEGPYETLEVEGNALLYGGADVLWLGLKAGLTASSGAKNTYFNNANAAILVGNSTTAVASSQTDLQASSGAANRFVVGMDATYPTHTTGTAASTSSKMLYKATFSSAQGNHAWREWGVGNKVSQVKPYPGRLLNRKVQNLGTKTSLGIWALTVTLSEA